MKRQRLAAALLVPLFAIGCGGEATNPPADNRGPNSGGALEPTDTGPVEAPKPEGEGAADAETPKPTGEDPGDDPAEIPLPTEKR